MVSAIKVITLNFQQIQQIFDNSNSTNWKCSIIQNNFKVTITSKAQIFTVDNSKQNLSIPWTLNYRLSAIKGIATFQEMVSAVKGSHKSNSIKAIPFIAYSICWKIARV